MNQIANVEETNRREVESKIIEEFQDKDYIITSDGKLYVEIDAHWLHHQLQKAREDTMRKVMSKLRNQFDSEDDELSLEEIEVALYELDHSELDQDNKYKIN